MDILFVVIAQSLQEEGLGVISPQDRWDLDKLSRPFGVLHSPKVKRAHLTPS
jgi:hypothetical protein